MASYTPLQLGMALKSVKSAVMRSVVLVRVWGGRVQCMERTRRRFDMICCADSWSFPPPRGMASARMTCSAVVLLPLPPTGTWSSHGRAFANRHPAHHQPSGATAQVGGGFGNTGRAGPLHWYVWGGWGEREGEGRGRRRDDTSRAALLPRQTCPNLTPSPPTVRPPRTHGSVLFTRGETQALCVATLGSKTDALRSESIRSGGGGELPGESFYLHYFFPPSSVGEVGKVGGPGEEVAAERRGAYRYLGGGTR